MVFNFRNDSLRCSFFPISPPFGDIFDNANNKNDSYLYRLAFHYLSTDTNKGYVKQIVEEIYVHKKLSWKA